MNILRMLKKKILSYLRTVFEDSWILLGLQPIIICVIIFHYQLIQIIISISQCEWVQITFFIEPVFQNINIFSLLSDITKATNPHTFEKLQLYAFLLDLNN